MKAARKTLNRREEHERREAERRKEKPRGTVRELVLPKRERRR